MEPLVLLVLQGIVLLLLYLFVWRVARAIVRDLRSAPPARGESVLIEAPRPAPVAGVDARRPARDVRPPPRAVPRELVVHRAGTAPRVLGLDGGEITFGRASPSTVVLDDPYVSDRHARVWHDGTAWVVGDLGSTNGTYLNQRKVTRATPIAAGDQLGIGKTVVEVRR